jgi:hypothetical protein
VLSIGARQEVFLERIVVTLLFCAQINELSMLAVAILLLMEMIAAPVDGLAATQMEGRDDCEDDLPNNPIGQ